VNAIELLPGVRHGLDDLHAAGLLLIVVSNQPDVARGTLERAVVEEINARLAAELPLDAIACCFHDDADQCACRKPRPGLLVDAAASLGVTLERSFLVGDRWRDIEAGRRAGCTTILLRKPYSGTSAKADFEVADFGEATAIILHCMEERK
jgi:D-glycero-D-manno-heptose 1,7-bisphosphate phosphatase